MKEIKYPSTINFWNVKDEDGDIVCQGITEPNQVTTTGQSVIEGSDNADDVYPPLPEEVGTLLEEGEIYSYNGGMVIINKEHERTIYEPMLTPTLITFYRSEVGALQWIENEDVEMGMRRWFERIEYNVDVPHITQLTWTPILATTLWSKVPEQSDFPEWVQPQGNIKPYMTDNNVTYEGDRYTSTIDNNVWKPTEYGWELYTEKE